MSSFIGICPAGLSGLIANLNVVLKASRGTDDRFFNKSEVSTSERLSWLFASFAEPNIYFYSRGENVTSCLLTPANLVSV